MATKLFNTVNLYDTPVTHEAINATAAEMLLVDLSAIGADVVVTFPAGTIEGQCIGIQVYQENGTNSITGAGPVDVRPFSLSFNADCALWTWDSTLGMWMMVSQYHQPQPSALEWLTPGGGTTPVNGDLSVDGSAQTIVLPDAPDDGTFIGVKSTNGATTVEASGTDSIDNGDGTSTSTYLLPYPGAAAIFVYDGGTWWMPASFARVAALKPEQDTLTGRTLSLLDIGLRIEFTDPGTVTVTVPAQGGGVGEVQWPNWATFDFVAQGGDLTVVGDAGVAINVLAGKDPTSSGAYARLRLERMSNVNEWVLSGDLADTGP